ncbi:MAG TPA: AAA family ATPase [Phycisphaerales bacterium]|nr:AAA family ATPase [Phycisphaerales bacterium]
MASAVEILRANIAKVYLGHTEAIDRLICCLLARGHVLIEDVPGVGKTVLAQALARSVQAVFSRLQLTPDLLPTDILGVSIFDRESQSFRFVRGPIFANIVLADEINRTPPRTQTALLEAMNEATVTVDGTPHRLEQPFMVIATQNPYEFEGTYPLPENQLDRFLMRINLGYPSPRDEARVLDLRPADHALHELRPVMTGDEVVELQARADAVRLDATLVDYIIALANATRQSEELQLGLSPRGSLALAQAARATAAMAGRDYAIPEDVTSNIAAVCAHRVFPKAYTSDPDSPDAPGAILERIMHGLESPA